MPSFVTNSRFCSRYDWRWIAKNLLDGPTAATSDPPPTLAELQGPTGAGAVLALLIEDASDMVMGAAAIGNRYTLADLTTYGGTLLERITSDLTMGLVMKRRARPSDDSEALAKPYAEALDYLEKLRQGERIFYAVPGVPEAGLPEVASMAPVSGVNPPLVSQCAARYFGSGRPTSSGGCGGGCGR